MRRLLAVLVVVPSLVLGLATGAPAGASAMPNPAPQATTPPTVTAIGTPTSDFSGIGTLDDGRPATECISSNPPPDCDSASKADGHTLVLLGILLIALTGIGCIVVRSTRRRDRARAAGVSGGRDDADR